MNTESLAEAFSQEQSRCRELLGAYKEIGPAGQFGAVMIEDMLKRADEAVMSGDVVEIIRLFKEMQGCE